MELQNQSLVEKSINKIRQSASIRMFIIGVLVLVLLIPTGMIEGLISDRETNHANAVNEMSDKWGGAQIVTGPVLAIPYMEFTKDDKGQVTSEKKYSYYLPSTLDITGDIHSEKRHRGIYEAVLYESKLHFKGNFEPGFLGALPHLPETALLNEAQLLVGITDVRGIRGCENFKWDTTTINPQPGAGEELLKSGINFPMSQITFSNGGSFEFDLKLAGSQSLHFTPVAKKNTVNISSNWISPSFDGAFLPISHAESNTGFKARWQVLELNRSFVQHWNDGTQNLNASDFGLKMWISADEYQKAHRSVHYCVLFISLTFIFYFIIELKSGINVHPVQYLLIGLAISIFYLLLLSFSEWIGFNASYFISAVAVTALISLFSMGVLQNKLYSIVTGIVQSLLYIFLYTTLQLEDLSLLIGSIGLFITLVILMYFSRKLNVPRAEV